MVIPQWTFPPPGQAGIWSVDSTNINAAQEETRYTGVVKGPGAYELTTMERTVTPSPYYASVGVLPIGKLKSAHTPTFKLSFYVEDYLKAPFAGEVSFSVDWQTRATSQQPFTDSPSWTTWSMTVDLGDVAEKVLDITSTALLTGDMARHYRSWGRFILKGTIPKSSVITVVIAHNVKFNWQESFSFFADVTLQFWHLKRLVLTSEELDPLCSIRRLYQEPALSPCGFTLISASDLV